MMDRNTKIEQIILEKSKSSRYLDKLSDDEKNYLDNIFFFLDSYQQKVKSLISKTFSETYCLTCKIKNKIPYDYIKKAPKKFCSNICNFKSDEFRLKNSLSQKNRKKNPMHSDNAKQRYVDTLNNVDIKFTERRSDIEESILLKKRNTNQYHTILSAEEKSYMSSFWGYAKTARERVFLLENNIFTRQKCVNCKMELNSPLISNIDGIKYLKRFCNIECKNKSKEVRQLISNSVSRSYEKDLELSGKKLKSGTRWREFLMPSGKIVSTQGYEEFGIIEILKTHDEDDIFIHKNIPIVKYYYGGIHRNHYADFYIKSTNTLIDVKSQFTYDVEIEKNKAKKLAAEIQGFNYNFMIVLGKKNEKKTIKNY